jgi:hypothetical protein
MRGPEHNQRVQHPRGGDEICPAATLAGCCWFSFSCLSRFLRPHALSSARLDEPCTSAYTLPMTFLPRGLVLKPLPSRLCRARPPTPRSSAHGRQRGEREGEGTRARSLTALIDSALGEDPALNRVYPGWRGRARHLRPRRLLRTAAAVGGPADAEEEAHERDVELAGTVSAPVAMDPVRQPYGSP